MTSDNEYYEPPVHEAERDRLKAQRIEYGNRENTMNNEPSRAKGNRFEPVEREMEEEDRLLQPERRTVLSH